MTDLTKDELIDKLLGEYYPNEDKETLDIEEMMSSIIYDEWEDTDNFKMVDEEGGHEGGGEYVHRVLHYTPTDQFFGPVGWYASHHGTEYEETKLFKPFQTTKYQSIKD